MKAYLISIYSILLIAGILITPQKLVAQQTTQNYKLTAVVADSVTKKTLAYVTVALNIQSGSRIITGTTQPGGSFTFEGLQHGKYNLTLASLGYKPRIVPLILTANTRMDTIFLAEQVNQLKEVNVTASKPVIKQLADRIIYDMQADPESKGNNLLTMMRKVPYLSLDAGNNLLFKGNSSYRVLINGKTSDMADNNLKAVLQTMPASTIQSIEVITNPPAKYDAEGMAGVINIITNKNTGKGFKGTLNANESFPLGGPGIGTLFSAKNGRLGATGYGGASINNAPVTQIINNRAAIGTNANQLIQNVTNKSKGRSGYFGTELTYEVDQQNLITAQFGINGNHDDSESHQANIITTQQGFLQSYDLDNAGNNRSNGIDAGINYQLGFKANEKRLLTVSYRYYNFNNLQFNAINTSNLVNYTTSDYRQDNNTGNREHTFQINYVQQVHKLYIESGLKGIWRNSESNFDYLLFNQTNGLYEVDGGLSDSFNYSQKVFGGYNSYRYSINSWSFSGGARIEQTFIDADFTSTQSKIDQSIFNVLPNISVNKEFNDKSSLSFGFNQRIKRPNIRRLNPFIDRSNPNFETNGNPKLRPVLNNNLQLSYSNAKKLSINMSLGYSFVNNIDLRISTLDAVTNITRTTYQNTGKAKRLGLDYNLSYPFTNKWNISANGGIEYINVSGFVGNVLVKKNLLMSSVSISTGYRFDKGWRLNGNVSYRSRSLTDLQGTASTFASTACSINKELVKNKLFFAAVVNNPISKYRYSVTTTSGPNFTQVNNNQLNFRSVNLSLNYNFGSLKDEVKKNRRNINNDDSGR